MCKMQRAKTNQITNRQAFVQTIIDEIEWIRFAFEVENTVAAEKKGYYNVKPTVKVMVRESTPFERYLDSLEMMYAIDLMKLQRNPCSNLETPKILNFFTIDYERILGSDPNLSTARDTMRSYASDAYRAIDVLERRRGHNAAKRSKFESFLIKLETYLNRGYHQLCKIDLWTPEVKNAFLAKKGPKPVCAPVVYKPNHK